MSKSCDTCRHGPLAYCAIFGLRDRGGARICMPQLKPGFRWAVSHNQQFYAAWEQSNGINAATPRDAS
jgi:hypothetical protein